VQTAQGQDQARLTAAPQTRWTVHVDVAWHYRHAARRFQDYVRRDAEARFHGARVAVVLTGAFRERWTITGTTATPVADQAAECRRLHAHYAEGFGPEATVSVEGAPC
jgi:hypothetical protein